MKTFFLIAVAFLFAHATPAQVYIGGGYAEAYLTEAPEDDATGIVISAEKEFKIDSGRWKLITAMHIGILYSKMGQQFLPAYSTTLSISPKISYDIIKLKRLTLAPFAGPFAGWLTGIQAGDLLYKPQQIGGLRYGVEVGLAANIAIHKKLHIKLVPVSIQYGNNFFKQGMVSLLIAL